jgi:hypothetical protein
MSVILLDKNGNKDKKLTRKFRKILRSKHYDTFMPTTWQYWKLENLLNHANLIEKWAKSHGLTVYFSSGVRTPKINQLVNGSTSSQHPWIEGLDVVFYKNGKQVTGKCLAKLFNTAKNELDHLFQQMFCYNSFMHFGLTTSRKVRKKRGFL